MTTTAPTAKDLVTAQMREAGIDMDADTMRDAMAKMTEAQCQEILDNTAKAEAEKVELRARLMADATLRQAVCPATTYMTADDRFAIAKRGIAILEATAAKHAARGVTVDNLAAVMVAEHMTVQDQIDMHGTDPRWDGTVGSNNSFYAFRYRVRDAMAIITADADKAAHAAHEAQRDAAWAAKGEHRCERCGGQGGSKAWPGFTCYDCGGRGSMPGVVA
jgi:hypothetical protein